MIIHTNSQAAGHGSLLNPAGGFLAKPLNQFTQNRDAAEASEESQDAIARGRIGADHSRVAEITDTQEAEDAVLYARNYILSNPLSSLGVQANTNSSSVLNLLSDLIYS
ncbi:MAG: hypothetical protein O2960_05685 [Verrucomicrobia bacterium]|nr:hypothetical protein [Verrucomicrobiota bacterium]